MVICTYLFKSANDAYLYLQILFKIAVFLESYNFIMEPLQPKKFMFLSFKFNKILFFGNPYRPQSHAPVERLIL